MSQLILARRYAKALCGCIDDKSRLDKIKEELDVIVAHFKESKELLGLFLNPGVHPEVKRKVLDEILTRENPSGIVKDFIGLLLKKKRIGFLSEITYVYGEMVDILQGRIRMKVTSAVKLDDEGAKSIQNKFRQITTREVILVSEEDPSIIGGIVVQMGDTVLDGSISNQLSSIKDSLDREAVA